MFPFGIWRAYRMRRAAARLRGLAKNDRGSVVIMFGLTIFIIFTIVGSAVDYGRAMLARARLQAAVDSSVLAAARVWQLENDITLAKQKGLAHFETNKPTEPSRVVQFSEDMVAATFTMVGETTVRTPFLSFVQIPQIVVATRGQALIAGGGNAGTNVEVSLMLDVTGSMAGTKIDDLKAAAKDLIDIVIWSDQSEYTSRVGLAPFSTAINAGDLGATVSFNPASKQEFRVRDGKSTTKKTRYRTSGYCLSERTGPEALTDAAPVDGNKLPRVYGNSGSSCVPSAPVVPLTSNKDTLKGVIDGFVASGNTAGHLGTAWAWYLLSPNWANVLPEGSKPKPYSMLADVGEKGQPLLTKYAVLMTDGEFNYQYCNSTVDGVAGATMPDYDTGSSGSSCKSPNGTSTKQVSDLCKAMDAAGITVYAVGFGLDDPSTARTTLKNCASKPHMFYDTKDGVELRNAFRHIATSIAAPILSR